MKTLTNDKPYGKELILDLHNCDVEKFNKFSLDKFFVELAELTDMELCKRYWWTMDECPPEWKDIPHLNGISAVQFISTSNFTIHTLTDLKAVYLNIFTCKDFDQYKAIQFVKEFFAGKVVSTHVIMRK